jgi:serine phosphatase RsbU (regulator of sigma subunit)
MYVIVIVAFALRKRLDLARWVLAISTVLAEVETGVSDMSGLGVRWTHWTLHHQLYRSLFTLAGTPINISTLVNLFLLVSILYAAWRYSVEQNQRQSVLEQEFRSAQEIQQILIPDALPSLIGYTVTSAYQPAQEVGGDFYQIIPLIDDLHNGQSNEDQSAIIVIGDVSGKGLKAAMTVSLLVGAIRSTVETTRDPAHILSALNRRLYGRVQNGFATCLVLLLDASGRGTLANAGHLPPFLNGREFPLEPALPLGLLPEADYESTAFQLAIDDQLILYTDGLLEARNPGGELFGFGRIAQLTAARPDAHRIANAAVQFGQDDDITVLALGFSGV